MESQKKNLESPQGVYNLSLGIFLPLRGDLELINVPANPR